MTATRKILVTPPNFDAEAVALLRAHNCEPTFPDKPESALSQSELADWLADAQGWILGPQANVTRALIEAAPACRVFSRRGVGFERLDVVALRELGRVGAIATGGNEESVADHAVGLMLAVGRRMREQHLAMLAGDTSIRVSTDLFAKTVGVVGLGRAGSALVRRLAGFRVCMLAATPRPDAQFCRLHNVSVVDLDTLLRESDYVSLHAPYSAATRHMIDAVALSKMQATSVLINTGRGGLVDDAALLAALRAGNIGGAGLDVYESESQPALLEVTRQLLALPNVVATPHSAASTREGLARTNAVAARNVIATLDGNSPPRECLLTAG